MATKESANFREIPDPNCCGNCNNKTHHTEQGWSKCTKLENNLIPWGKQRNLICDCWEEVPEISEKDKLLKELGPEKRRILGLQYPN